MSERGQRSMLELSLAISTFTAVVGALAAIFSARCAFLAYHLSRKIQDDLKSDEEIIVGPLLNPHLSNENQSNSVIVCTLFNKSRRKSYVHSVCATDEEGEKIDIKWASSINQVGNPQEPFCLEGLIDSVDLYVRRKDGEEIDYMSLEISHSFPDSPATVVYNPSANWSF